MNGAASIALIGGHPALDFANTAGWHASDSRHEWLTDYGDVVGWARHAAGLPATEAAGLLKRAARDPVAARRAYGKVIRLREADYRIFAALAQHRAPAEEDLAELHAAHVAALEAARFAPGPDGRLVLAWPSGGADFLRPIHSVMVDAAALLGSADLARLRQCGNHPCGWLFLDRSRNGSRRWCSSAECGNASRVRRFRARQRPGQ
jgi:predicted RNA-binding Zn ribbon-like protein